MSGESAEYLVYPLYSKCLYPMEKKSFQFVADMGTNIGFYFLFFLTHTVCENSVFLFRIEKRYLVTKKY